MSTAASLSRKEQLEAIIGVRKSTSTTPKQVAETKAVDSRFVSIESNPFFAIIFNENLSPEQKQTEIAKTLTFSGTREQNREQVKAFDLFKEYLQAEREAMATQIIKMSDTENFALLKETFEEINNALIDFENDMKPLTDIIDALHVLRSNNQTLDAFREIKDDELRQKAIANRDAEISAEIDRVNERINSLRVDSEVASKNKGWGGFGSIKQESVEQIARNNIEIANETARLAKISEEALANSATVTTDSIVDANAKQKLKEMLDLSSDNHRQRSKDLINSAVHFVTTSGDKIQTIRQHLGHMGDQVQNLDDANGQMSFIYAIIGEGVQEAGAENKKLRENLAPKENESMVEKLTRETKVRDLNEHIQTLEISNVDTVATVADLTTASIRIKNMNDANQQQMQMARDMHSRGVAGVADRLSTVIQAVGAAAISESNAMTAETLNAMVNNTDVIAQKESMRIAMGTAARNDQLTKAIEGLTQYGEVNKAATEFTREAMVEMKKNLELMEQASIEVAKSVSASKAVVADVAMGDKPKVASAQTTKKGVFTL